jgi:hypothetical protein
MKKSLTLLGITALGLTTQAQIANFSAAPDFTGTDINGTSWNLYDLLDQGKTVIMDVSATWCAPCWAYHGSGALEDLYTAHGPGGTNDVMVLFIEGDNTTNNDDLHGLTSESQGDWTAGSPYPIIDDASIGDDYQITYFPTIFKICPNRVVTEVGQIDADALYSECQACLGLAETGTNVSMITYTGAMTACQDGTLDIPVKIQNRGTDALTTCNLEVRENGSAIATTTWNGNLATYAMATVTFQDVAFSDPSALTVHMTTPDVDADDNVVSPGIAAFPNAQANITFNLTTDWYCSETTWRLKNSAGTIVESGGPYDCAAAGGGAEASTNFSYGWILPYDCYSLEILDAYGDGLYCQYTGVTAPNGSFSLVNGNGNILWEGNDEIDVNLIYFASTTGGMKVNQPVGIEENALNSSLNIYPNPSNGLVYVNFSMAKASEVRMEVYNTLGAMVRNLNTTAPAGVQLRNIDLSDLSNGVYSLNITADGMKTSRLITIAK